MHYLLFNTIISLIKTIIFSRFINIPKWDNNNRKCIILGNGPSTNDIIPKLKLIGKEYSILCVNHFASSEQYTETKPNIYVIAAIELFTEIISSKFLDIRKNLINDIYYKTTWKLFLFIPIQAKFISEWNQLKNNRFIHIQYYNLTAIEGFDIIDHQLFKNLYGLPRPHNVLIPSLIITINLSFKEIFLFGVEHSWLEDIIVDENNNVLINQVHFYDQKKIHKPMHWKGKRKRKLHEVIIKFFYTFRSYHIINRFAERNSSKIFNTLPNSYIDAFEKITFTFPPNAKNTIR